MKVNLMDYLKKIDRRVCKPQADHMIHNAKYAGEIKLVYAVEGSYRETARICGCCVKTVKNALNGDYDERV